VGKHRWVAELSLLGITFVWGATFVVVQNAIAVLPPFSFLAVRFGIAFLFLAGILGWQSRRKPTESLRNPSGRGGIWLGVWLFLGYALQTYSLIYTTSGKSGFLTGISVALIPLLSFFILGIKPAKSALAGTGLAVAGLYLLAFTQWNSINRGDILAFLCAISFGLQIVFTAKFVSHSNTLALVTWQVGVVSGLSLAAAWLYEPWERLLQPQLWWTPEVAAALLITSLLATVLGYVGQTHFQRFIPPTRVALIFTMEPVFAALTDFLWMGVPLTPRSLAGCALIFAGMVLAEWTGTSHDEKDEQREAHPSLPASGDIRN
jgi:drug/metabolite transporter (DMT)-like permease